MVLGERALAVERRRDRRAGELGEAHQLGRRSGVEHALPGHDHRTLGREQASRGLARRRRRSACVSRGSDVFTFQSASPAGPFSTSFAIATSTGPLRAPRSAFSARRNTAGPRAASLSVAAKRVIGAVGELAAHARGSVPCTATACSLGSSRIGLRSPKACATAAKAASAPGPYCVTHGSEALAVGGAREAVGDVDRDALGARDDRAHPEQRGRVEQAVLGEADDRLGALALEQLGRSRSATRARSPSRTRVGDLGRGPPHHGLGCDRHAREARKAELAAAADEDAARASAASHTARRRRRARRARSSRATGARADPAASSSLLSELARVRRPARGAASTNPGSRDRGEPAASAARLTLNGSCTRSSSRATSGVRDRVAEAQAGQPEDLRERADHDHGRARRARRAADRRARPGRRSRCTASSATTMQSCRQAVEEGRPAGARDQRAGGVVRDRRSRRGARAVATAASATASRSIASPAGGTRVTIPPAAADTVAYSP